MFDIFNIYGLIYGGNNGMAFWIGKNKKTRDITLIFYFYLKIKKLQKTHVLAQNS